MTEKEKLAVIRSPGGVEFYYPLNQCEMIEAGTSRIAAPIQHVIELTGPLPTAKDKKQEIIDLLAPSFQDGFYGYLSSYLATLREWAQYENLVDAYKRGAITPELLAILKEEPAPVPQELQSMDTPTAILTLLRDKKLDFEPFRHDIDIEANWFFFYRVSFHPLPIRRSLDSIAAGVDYQKKETLEHLKTQVSMLMKGERPGAYEGKPVPPLAPEPLEKFAAAIEKQYKARKRGRTPRDFTARIARPAAAGLYVNPQTCEIKDLRPFLPELYSLLSVKSWDFLAEYAAAIREAVKEELERLKATPTELFKGADFVPLKTTPESMAISSVATGIAPLYFQPSLPGIDDMRDYTAELIVPKKEGALRLKLKSLPNGRGLRPSTQKVKTLLEGIFTMTRKTAFVFSVRDYMRLCEEKPPYTGIKYRKFAQKLRQDLQTLKNLSFSASYPGLPAGEISILDGFVPSPGGGMEITMGQRYCMDLLAKGGISQICRTFWRADERNPHAIPFLLKLCANRTMANNIKRGGNRARTISLKSLFDHDRINFPSLEKVKKNRRYKELLIDPIIKTLAQLNDEGHITSRYVNANHEEHTAEDLSNVTFAEFMDAKRWLLEYEINGFEEDPQLLIDAQERKEEKKKGAFKKKTKPKTEPKE